MKKFRIKVIPILEMSNDEYFEGVIYGDEKLASILLEIPVSIKSIYEIIIDDGVSRLFYEDYLFLYLANRKIH